MRVMVMRNKYIIWSGLMYGIEGYAILQYEGAMYGFPASDLIDFSGSNYTINVGIGTWLELPLLLLRQRTVERASSLFHLQPWESIEKSF